MFPLETQHYMPRPRGRPPLGDKQRGRLTLKLSAGAASRNVDAKPEVEESEAQLEEQFILRVLPEMAAHFGKLVAERRIQDQLEIKFRDERNAVVKFEGNLFVAKLVDMPTITESYRTIDKKQLLKTADVCQILVIERQITEAETDQAPLARGLDIIHPDGLAPPLANVRKNRFRPRISKGKIDAIEEEVLRLLEDDAQAMAVKFDLYDEQGDDGRGGTPSIDIMSPVTLDDLNTPMVDEDAMSSIANDDLGSDEDLVAALARDLEYSGDEDGDEDEDEDEESGEEDEEQPNNERSMQIKLLDEEIAELEHTIIKKNADLDSAPNPIIRKRFEDNIQRLQQQLDAKKEQLDHYSKELLKEADTENSKS